jgi:hypothetical protein
VFFFDGLGVLKLPLLLTAKKRATGAKKKRPRGSVGTCVEMFGDFFENNFCCF